MIRFGAGRGIWLLSAAILFLVLLLGVVQLGTSSDAQAQPPYPGPCDVNEDGTETVQDALLIAQQVVGLIDSGDIAQDPADCDGNGEVSISDALLVAQKVVGLA